MKWKAILGLVLAVASLAALYLWETKFEDEVSLTSVLVLSEDHLLGDTIELSDLKVLKINPQAKLENALTEKDASQIEGKILKTDLVEKQQLLLDYFVSKEEILPKGYINFVIPKDWIYSKSVLVEEKDMATLYAMPEKKLLGTYKIAIDSKDSLEIITSLEDYFKIYDAVNAGSNKLLVLMEEDL